MGKTTDEEIANTVTTNDMMVGAQGEDIVILLLNCRMDHEKALRLAAWIVDDMMVGAQGEDIVIPLLNCRMDREKALRLAAWIVAIADPVREDFERIFAAVCST